MSRMDDYMIDVSDVTLAARESGLRAARNVARHRTDHTSRYHNPSVVRHTLYELAYETWASDAPMYQRVAARVVGWGPSE